MGTSHEVTLLRSEAKDGKPLAARTVGHAHRVLHRGLERLVEREELSRNVARVVSPPKVDDEEVQILTADQMGLVLRKFEGHDLWTHVNLTLASGVRRGELLAAQFGDVDLEGGSLKIERSLEETAAGLRFKSPKTKHGRRTISLPPSAIAVLREHRRKLFEMRLVLGLGRPDEKTLVFGNPDGSPRSPSNLTSVWRWACKALDLPQVSYALRYTHASALIAAGVDVATISRRMAHANPTITLKVYAHLFTNTDAAAAAAIEVAMRTGGERGDR